MWLRSVRARSGRRDAEELALPLIVGGAHVAVGRAASRPPPMRCRLPPPVSRFVLFYKKGSNLFARGLPKCRTEPSAAKGARALARARHVLGSADAASVTPACGVAGWKRLRVVKHDRVGTWTPFFFFWCCSDPVRRSVKLYRGWLVLYRLLQCSMVRGRGQRTRWLIHHRSSTAYLTVTGCLPV